VVAQYILHVPLLDHHHGGSRQGRGDNQTHRARHHPEQHLNHDGERRGQIHHSLLQDGREYITLQGLDRHVQNDHIEQFFGSIQQADERGRNQRDDRAHIRNE
jgi:hypothetical protein